MPQAVKEHEPPLCFQRGLQVDSAACPGPIWEERTCAKTKNSQNTNRIPSQNKAEERFIVFFSSEALQKTATEAV